MDKKYDIEDSRKHSKSLKEVESFIDDLSKIKHLDEQNPLEQAIKYRAVKQNPPIPGYMEVRLFEDKDEKGNPVVVSESDEFDDNGKLVGLKRFKHDPFYTIDLAKLLMADITSCPSSVGPMLIDMAQKLVELKKGAFKVEKRTSEWNWWWIVIGILLIPGIITVILLMTGGGG